MEGHLSEQKNPRLGAEDIRFTTQGDTLYATALGLADKEWRIRSLGAASENLQGRKIKDVILLGYRGGVDWRQDDDALVIQSPGADSGKHAWVFKLSLD